MTWYCYECRLDHEDVANYCPRTGIERRDAATGSLPGVPRSFFSNPAGWEKIKAAVDTVRDDELFSCLGMTRASTDPGGSESEAGSLDPRSRELGRELLNRMSTDGVQAFTRKSFGSVAIALEEGAPANQVARVCAAASESLAALWSPSSPRKPWTQAVAPLSRLLEEA